MLGVAFLAIGAAAGAAGTGGLPLDQPEEAKLRPGLGKSVAELRSAHRRSVHKAMTAPRVLGVSRAHLEAIAECESHGDPRAVSSDGLYRGKYQFHRGTWASMGGSGDPAKAPELEQDIRAAALIKASGSNPWPICG